MNVHYDLIVIGAGPSGSTTAYHASKLGIKTLIIDKQRFPRNKICAGGLTLASVKLLDFQLPEELIEGKCRGGVVYYKGRKCSVELPEDVVYMISRKRFDNFLLEKAIEAGAVRGDGIKCTGIERQGTEIKVLCENGSFSAPIIVGADGYNSIARKSFYRPYTREEGGICITSEINLDDIKNSELIQKPLFHVDYGVVEKGYGWIFPKKHIVSVGIGCTLFEAYKLKETFAKFINTHSILDQTRKNIKVVSAFIPLKPDWKKFVFDNALLVGDAGGFVDPFTGEGIRYAIISGKEAAISIYNALNRGDPTAHSLKEFEERCREGVLKELQSLLGFTDFIFGHKRIVLPVAVSNRKAMNRYLTTFTGKLKFSDFKKWLKRRSFFIVVKSLKRLILEKPGKSLT